jgi:hypothetical protein
MSEPEYYQAPMTAATIREALDYLHDRAVALDSIHTGRSCIETEGQYADALAALAVLTAEEVTS